MAEEAPAVAPAKPAKKKAAPRPKKDGPTLPKLVLGVVAESKERKGMSLLALKKVLDTKGVDVSKSNKRINSTVTRLVAGGSLVRTKGSGASGSFRLAKKEPKAAVKPAKKVVQKAAAKAKKPTAKKPAAKKPAAKKSPKKAPAKKAVKKPVPKKSPKKAAPKKAVKKPAKKTPVKKAPAKKVAAKKSKK